MYFPPFWPVWPRKGLLLSVLLNALPSTLSRGHCLVLLGKNSLHSQCRFPTTCINGYRPFYFCAIHPEVDGGGGGGRGMEGGGGGGGG